MIYIVVREVYGYPESDIDNVAVFDERQKAVDYIESDGYKYSEDLKLYIKPGEFFKGKDDNRCYIEEWEVNTNESQRL